jgi:hypothetical protein
MPRTKGGAESGGPTNSKFSATSSATSLKKSSYAQDDLATGETNGKTETVVLARFGILKAVAQTLEKAKGLRACCQIN